MSQWPFNMELGKAVTIHTRNMSWVASPSAGVERKPLEREKAESGRTSSIVRYAPGSSFPHHVHDGGEEFLVLKGIFSDEHDDYPTGTYVRNPPMSAHAPFTENGCTIFVKLCQFQRGDRQRVVLDTHKMPQQQPYRQAICSVLLHQFNSELVELERWKAGVKVEFPEDTEGVEIFVLKGDMQNSRENFPEGSWIRRPAGVHHSFMSVQGCLIYKKTGHLHDSTDTF